MVKQSLPPFLPLSHHFVALSRGKTRAERAFRGFSLAFGRLTWWANLRNHSGAVPLHQGGKGEGCVRRGYSVPRDAIVAEPGHVPTSLTFIACVGPRPGDRIVQGEALAVHTRKPSSLLRLWIRLIGTIEEPIVPHPRPFHARTPHVINREHLSSGLSSF